MVGGPKSSISYIDNPFKLESHMYKSFCLLKRGFTVHETQKSDNMNHHHHYHWFTLLHPDVYIIFIHVSALFVFKCIYHVCY